MRHLGDEHFLEHSINAAVVSLDFLDNSLQLGDLDLVWFSPEQTTCSHVVRSTQRLVSSLLELVNCKEYSLDGYAQALKQHTTLSFLFRQSALCSTCMITLILDILNKLSHNNVWARWGIQILKNGSPSINTADE